MRKALMVIVVLAIVAVPTAVLAAGRYRSGGVDRQSVETYHEDVTTSNENWTELARVSAACPVSRNVAVTLSLALQGGSAPVEVRVRAVPVTDPDARTGTAAPGVIPFAVGSADDARAFTFSAYVGDADHGRDLVAQWRSPSGEAATATARSLHLLYEGIDHPCL